MAKTIRIGFLGFGTVGTGAFRMLQDNRDAIVKKIGLSFEVAKIGIKDTSKERGVDPSLFTISGWVTAKASAFCP